MCIIIRIALLALGLSHCTTISATNLQSLVDQSVQDYKSYYNWGHLTSPALLLGVSGIAANSFLDARINHTWQSQIRSQALNQTLDPFNAIGGLRWLIPLYFTASWMNSPWGNHAFRMILLGGPQQVALTHLLGAQRPEQGNSHWHLLQGKRSVSGHAFYGAVPFLSVAETINSKPLRATFYTLATLPGLARLNKNKHYFSQVLLGWGLAYFVSATIQQNTSDKINLHLTPEKHSLLFSASLKF